VSRDIRSSVLDMLHLGCLLGIPPRTGVGIAKCHIVNILGSVDLSLSQPLLKTTKDNT